MSLLRKYRKKARKACIPLALLLAVNVDSFGQSEEAAPVPVSAAFHDFGKNLWRSVSYNYGLNFVVSSAGTYGMVKAGWDWDYRQFVYGNRPLAVYGMTANVTGYIVPVASPVIAYTIGRLGGDVRLQTAGLALAQTTIIASGLNAALKVTTNRRESGIYDLDPQKTDFSDEFRLFKFFSGGTIDGWPSGHTMNAVAAAVTLSEIYHDELWVKVAAYSYAVVLSYGMTFCDHWVSDVLAGWLLGYGIGKTIGASFSPLTSPKESALSLDIRPNYVGVKVSI